MRLSTLFNWKTLLTDRGSSSLQTQQVAEVLPESASLPAPTLGADTPNVVPFVGSTSTSAARLGATESKADEFATSPPTAPRVAGLMNAPEIEAFFAVNYFGFGRHDGCRSGSQEALEIGRRALIARFQNVVVALAERRKGKLDMLQRQVIDIEGVSAGLSSQLQLACSQLQRQIDLLNHQHSLAADNKGWILEALNRYQQGFERGVREALDFDNLLA